MNRKATIEAAMHQAKALGLTDITQIAALIEFGLSMGEPASHPQLMLRTQDSLPLRLASPAPESLMHPIAREAVQGRVPPPSYLPPPSPSLIVAPTAEDVAAVQAQVIDDAVSRAERSEEWTPPDSLLEFPGGEPGRPSAEPTLTAAQLRAEAELAMPAVLHIVPKGTVKNVALQRYVKEHEIVYEVAGKSQKVHAVKVGYTEGVNYDGPAETFLGVMTKAEIHDPAKLVALKAAYEVMYGPKNFVPLKVNLNEALNPFSRPFARADENDHLKS